MKTARLATVVGMITLLVAALIAPAEAGHSGSSGLRFTVPVEMNSFAPSRTAVSDVYTFQNQDQAARHEWSGEPVIAVDDKGTIFIGGTCCVVAASPTWYSTDGGKHFKELESDGHVREWGTGAEGTFSVDNKGDAYFVDTYVPSLLLTKWSDEGNTWDYTLPSSGVTPGVDDRPWVSWTKKGLFLFVNHDLYVQIYRSTDEGQTWTSSGPLAYNGSTSGQPFFPGHMTADPKTGTVWVTGPVNGSKGSFLASAVSTDLGKTFTDRKVYTPPKGGGLSPQFPTAVATDAAGNGYLTWSSYDKNGCNVYYAYSTDNGKSWSAPVKVNTSQGCATFPWIAAGDDGKLGIVWYQTDYNKQIVAANASNAYQDLVPPEATWFAHAATITDARSHSPSITSSVIPTKIAAGGYGPIHAGPLQRSLWDFFQVAIGPDGRMHIAYAVDYKDTGPVTWYVRNTNGPLLK